MENRTLGEKAAEGMMRIIRERGYDTGDKLPNEYELSELLGVSRNTVREALRALASRNIVDIRQGAGTFMSQKRGVADDPLGFSLVEDRRKLTEDLLQIRCIVEPPIAALAAQNATQKEIDALGALCVQVEELIGRRADFAQKDMEFHTQIANCSGNQVMSSLIPVISEGVTVFSGVIAHEFEQTVKSHRSIYEAIRDRRATDAQQAMLFHLLYNRNRFLEAGESQNHRMI